MEINPQIDAFDGHMRTGRAASCSRSPSRMRTVLHLALKEEKEEEEKKNPSSEIAHKMGLT